MGDNWKKRRGKKKGGKQGSENDSPNQRKTIIYSQDSLFSPGGVEKKKRKRLRSADENGLGPKGGNIVKLERGHHIKKAKVNEGA